MKKTLMLGALVAMACSNALAMADETVEAPAPDPTPAVAPAVDPTPVVDAPTTTTTSTTVVMVPPTPIPAVASAKQEYHPDVVEPNPYPFKVGILFDLSAPSGVALGVEARAPHVPWFKLGFAVTTTLAPGYRFNLLIDPVKFGIAPVGNIELGHQTEFAIPGVDNSPKVDFTYCDLQGGIGLGSRDGFRFLILAGMSHLNGTAHNFQGVVGQPVDGLTINDPTFNGWIPSAKIGFSYLF